MGWRRRACAVTVGAPTDASSHEAMAPRLGAAVTAGVLGAMVSPFLGLGVAGLVWARPAWQARARRRAGERDLVEAVPDLVELFRLAVGSGLSVHQAVRALAARVHGPGADALAEVVAREDRGERLADGLEGLSRRGEPLRPLAVALTAAERYGAPLAPGAGPGRVRCSRGAAASGRGGVPAAPRAPAVPAGPLHPPGGRAVDRRTAASRIVAAPDG